jgi:hypothetical protein
MASIIGAGAELRPEGGSMSMPLNQVLSSVQDETRARNEAFDRVTDDALGRRPRADFRKARELSEALDRMEERGIDWAAKPEIKYHDRPEDLDAEEKREGVA